MDENLLSPSNIILFGRLFPLRMRQADLPVTVGANRFLRAQLDREDARLARIYAFTYEGKFHHLPKPAVFLVHTNGRPISEVRRRAPALAALLRPATTSNTGMIARDFGFEPDVMFWEYDKGDFTLRLDIVSGTFDDVLLDAVLRPSSPDALISRSDLSARSDLSVRSDLSARSDLAMRHRFKE